MSDSKTCTRCGETKSLDEFYRKLDGHHSWCAECVREKSRQRREEDPRYWRDKFLRNTYGITYDEYMEMYEAQDGLCAICGQEEYRTRKNGHVDMLSVDHNHETGEVRALLCHRCNLLIGHAKEDLDRLRSAIEYLEKYLETYPEGGHFIGFPS